MPPDICPIGERPLLLPPNLLTKLTTMQWQRGTWHPLWVHISFQSLLKLSTTPGPGVPHLAQVYPTCTFQSGPAFCSASQGGDSSISLAALWPLCEAPLWPPLWPLPCPPSLTITNPSPWPWFSQLCFLTPGPPPDWEGLNQKRSERSFGSSYILLYTTPRLELKFRTAPVWYNPDAFLATNNNH